MKSADFIHLHVHTEYSLLDGAGRIADLLAKASFLKMPALAITDHGNMSGVVKFYKMALEVGIKPIIGCEVYLAPASRFDKTAGLKQTPYHLTLLARDVTGYRNLLVLVSRAHLEGFYYKPRIDWELLEAHHDGLFALSGCLKGEIPQALLAGRPEVAEEKAASMRDLFGEGNFYLEIHDQGVKEQKQVNPLLVKLSQRLNIPLAACNDCHYVNKEDAFSQEVMLCIQTGRKLEDAGRLKLSTEEFYLKSAGEMEELFKELPEALSNTRRIADRCHLELEFGKDLLPEFQPPPGKTPGNYLRELCEAGVRRRYGKETAKIGERLKHELSVIEGKNFASYFLIVWDLIHYAKTRKIPVGPGRGSVAGSLVAYLLEITDIDPFRQDLLFERFLNPSRMAMPDIDIDFSDQGRAELIKYVSRKYGGEDYVCQIITFGSMKARAVLRDVGRVLGMPYDDVDRIAKLVPPGPKITLKRALTLEPKLEELYKKDPAITRLFDVSFKLEGLARNASTHAAGVLISREPLTNHVPLCRGKDDEVVTQFDMHDAEEIGLLKMDFLGLRTLSVIQDTIDLVEKTRGKVVDLSRLPLDDQKTFRLLSKANTVGVFQLEGAGMRDLSHRIGLKTFDDIIALVALFRPGPMHMLEDYIARKHGKVKIHYDHPKLEPILKNTYGVMLYQEQVMRVANQLAGFTLAKADTLRTAMAKKKVDTMAQLEVAFSKGAAERGIKRAVAEKIFGDMARFAEYGFNKSHSAAYALIAYHTAYLKAYYPQEFMGSLLTSEIRNMDKLMVYVAECQAMGIKVLPPDINESFAHFTVVQNNIRFGLAAVKNVGEGAVEAIVAARQEGGPFQNFFNFLDRVDLFTVNKKVLESLIKCGALDSLPGNRAQKMAVLDQALVRAQRTSRDRIKGQVTLFQAFEFEDEAGGNGQFPEMEEWPQNELLTMEKELLGMYITGHPLSKYTDMIKLYATHSIEQLSGLPNRTRVMVGGIIVQVEEKSGRRTGRKFAVCQLEGLTGVVEVTLYNREYNEFTALLKPGQVVFVEGVLSSRDRGSNILASRLYPPDKVQERFARSLHINVHLASADEKLLKELLTVFHRHRGDCPVDLDFDFATGEKLLLRAGDKIKVKCTPQLVEDVEKILGENTVYIKAK